MPSLSRGVFLLNNQINSKKKHNAPNQMQTIVSFLRNAKSSGRPAGPKKTKEETTRTGCGDFGVILMPSVSLYSPQGEKPSHELAVVDDLESTVQLWNCEKNVLHDAASQVIDEC
ncbi:uncharacterized protein N7473_011061 [Penicillium subrubescens]|uniref:uncharacterized protein n=1 Tax=Penicillium subrubescens TaxID=1316194 RepID=UPI002544FECE|nr:uncharacterized protein N7473_011061 [Penicillium subrubescens]KAJ5882799.1 hypothetical protein N7473_011061 [Penicillium subrubescens]